MKGKKDSQEIHWQNIKMVMKIEKKIIIIMPSNKVFIDFVIPFLLVMYYIGIADNLKHFSSLLQKIILQVV